VTDLMSNADEEKPAPVTGVVLIAAIIALGG
jgi:hypothetical protein